LTGLVELGQRTRLGSLVGAWTVLGYHSLISFGLAFAPSFDASAIHLLPSYPTNLGIRVGVGSAVTIDELLGRLNTRARLPADETITARMLEDWAYEWLIPGPTRASGTREPNWQWSEESFDAALIVVEYRRRGFKRTTAIRAQGWLENQKFLSRVIPRKDIRKEFERARNLLFRSVSSTHGLRADATLSEYRQQALLRQLGPLDLKFERAGINLGGTVFVLSYEIARFGEQITPLDEDREPAAALLAKAVLPNGIHVLAGLLETDETHPLSAIRAIRSLSSAQFEQCRGYVSSLPDALNLMHSIITIFTVETDKKGSLDAVYLAVLNSFDRWPWMISAFAAVANVMYHSKMKPIQNEC